MFIEFKFFDSFSDGLMVHTVAGMIYNPFSGYWHWSDNTSLNYAAHAVKSSAQEHPEPAASALQGDAETLHASASSSRVHMKSWRNDIALIVICLKVYCFLIQKVYFFNEILKNKRSIKIYKSLEKNFCVT